MYTTFQLREIASENLEKNELVQLLSWVNAYGLVNYFVVLSNLAKKLFFFIIISLLWNF